MECDQANWKACVGVVLVDHEDHHFAMTDSDRHAEPAEARREASADAGAKAKAKAKAKEERWALGKVKRKGQQDR